MSRVERAELQKIIGKKIRELREQKGFTQVDLAGKIQGVFDTTNVSRIESGRVSPTLYTLYKIAEALEVPLKDLMDIEPNEE